LRLIVCFIISALVLLVLSFILPGFAVVGFGGALLAAVVIVWATSWEPLWVRK